MSSLKAMKDDIANSLGSMVLNDRSEEDMQNLNEAHGKPLKKSNEYIKAAGNPHKINNLVNEISAILQKDDQEFKGITENKKKAHHVKSKDYLGDKKNRIPSAAELMNNPLRESFQGLESGEGYGRSYKDLSKITAKDLSKSVSDNLNMTADKVPKEYQARRGRRGSVDVKRSAAIINSTLASTIELAEPNDSTQRKYSLGITGADLAKASKSSLEEVADKKDKKKAFKKSIGAALNEPFKKSMEDLGINDNEKPKTVKISAPKDSAMIVATKEHHRKHAHEKI
jgi:hypothetical protein